MKGYCAVGPSLLHQQEHQPTIPPMPISASVLAPGSAMSGSMPPMRVSILDSRNARWPVKCPVNASPAREFVAHRGLGRPRQYLGAALPGDQGGYQRPA
jgi:hypothetical protein